MKSFPLLVVLLCVMLLQGAYSKTLREKRSPQGRLSGSVSVSANGSGGGSGRSYGGLSGKGSLGGGMSISSSANGGGFFGLVMKAIKNIGGKLFNSLREVALTPFEPFINIASTILDDVVILLPGVSVKKIKLPDGKVKRSFSFDFKNILPDILHIPLQLPVKIAKIAIIVMINGMLAPLKVASTPFVAIKNAVKLIISLVQDIAPVGLNILQQLGITDNKFIMSLLGEITDTFGSLGRRMAKSQVAIAFNGINILDFGIDRISAAIQTISTFAFSIIDVLRKVIDGSKKVFAIDEILKLPGIKEVSGLIFGIRDQLIRTASVLYKDFYKYILSILDENKDFFYPRIESIKIFIDSFFMLIKNLLSNEKYSQNQILGSFILVKNAKGKQWKRTGIFTGNSSVTDENIPSLCSEICPMQEETTQKIISSEPESTSDSQPESESQTEQDTSGNNQGEDQSDTTGSVLGGDDCSDDGNDYMSQPYMSADNCSDTESQNQDGSSTS